MSIPPDIDPYAVLGVAKDATIPEIRAAHRKRVLKCHPDKIQDESQRIVAQEEFQNVQQAYELLSDDVRRTKHDQKVKIAELKRELLERRRTDSTYNSPRGSGGSTREFRNGHFMEERVPIEVFFEEELRFTDEPRSTTARKCEEFGLRSKTKQTEEKKKARTPMSMYHQVKEEREAAKATAKATHSDRAKMRDVERRRQAEAKRDTFESYAESDEETSDSSLPRRYHIKRTSLREQESRTRPSDSRRREHRYEEETDVEDHWQSKFDSQYFNAEDYIASKARSSKSPRRHHGHDSPEPELSGSRSTGRSTRTRRRSSSRDNSYEHLEPSRAYDARPPKLQPSATTPGIKGLRPFLNTRSATTTGVVRPKRESRDSTLYEMSREQLPSRTSRMRERNDSGYSSPSTPEMLPRGSSPKTSRYKVVTEPEHIVVEPKSSKYRSARSPDRDRVSSTRQTPKRSHTYTPEAPARVETRSARPSSRPHPDVEYITRPIEKDVKVKYGRAYKEEDVIYSPRQRYYPYDEEYRIPAAGRRQSAY
ncbi:Heat shock protein DnaJ [Penicillium cf. griseofulvum]|uniref:Heat shock protein DnaJ n=1 Tax=Penicillium cf. griseofulvum TaxID=2972120 RepID=A0A9W9M0P7_9EURO|nr:Heat shock protein DnaJ [Penicillium cf. griseofulvum]KAJ5430334.1 Heat shock protein DnaJ [Penicillium cf. griseofulvum]